MTANHTSRRSMLRGLALSPVAATAGAGTGLLISQAKASDSPDAELLATFAQWQDCLAEYDAANQAWDEAADRVVWPEPPEELFLRRGDTMGFVALSRRHANRRKWLGDSDRIAYLRETYVHATAREEGWSSEEHARACAVVQAYDEWMAAEKAAEAAAGLPEAVERHRRATAVNNDLRRTMANMPARTIEGIIAKTEAAVWSLGGSDELEAAAADGFSHDCEDMQVSILRDLVRMGKGVAA